MRPASSGRALVEEYKLHYEHPGAERAASPPCTGPRREQSGRLKRDGDAGLAEARTERPGLRLPDRRRWAQARDPGPPESPEPCASCSSRKPPSEPRETSQCPPSLRERTAQVMEGNQICTDMWYSRAYDIGGDPGRALCRKKGLVAPAPRLLRWWRRGTGYPHQPRTQNNNIYVDRAGRRLLAIAWRGPDRAPCIRRRSTGSR
jgi:hypothetical protein